MIESGDEGHVPLQPSDSLGRGGVQDPRAIPGDGFDNHPAALRLLGKYPHYRFVLDQACCVQPFLQRYAEEAEAFKACVVAGRWAEGGTIRLSTPVISSEEVNLMEDPGRKLALNDNSAQLDSSPFEIKTIALAFEQVALIVNSGPCGVQTNQREMRQE